MENEIKNNKDYLENKMWFRFCKVVYFMLLSISIITVVVSALVYRPQSSIYTDSEKTLINCDKGNYYYAKDVKVFLYEYESISPVDDMVLKTLCEFGTSDTLAVAAVLDKGKMPKVKNYGIEFFKTTNNYGSWEQVFIILILGLVMVLIVFEITKRVFLYITIGKNPLKIR